MNNTREIGKNGEERACRFLINNGYSILKRNYRIRDAEIDIIARKGDLVVFVEVKQRTTSVFGEPSESVTLKKQMKILKAAEYYLAQNEDDFLNCDIRFDIIGVIGPAVTHIPGAFDDIRE